MYKIWYINFGYYSQEEFVSFGVAYSYGKSKSFEFRIDAKDGTPLASWSPIGGFKDLVKPGSRWEKQFDTARAGV